ncbi:unnamed protein product, partial [Prorocentrum cordatum]
MLQSPTDVALRQKKFEEEMARACDDPQAPVTMGGMKALFDSYIAPVAESVQRLSQDLQDFRQKKDTGMENIRDETTQLREDVDILLNDFSTLDQQVEDDILPRIADIEKGIAEIKMHDEQFKGMLFSEFQSWKASQDALPVLPEACGRQSPREGNRWARCSTDAPIEQRAITSLLLGLRYLLTQWGFDKEFLKVDDDAGVIKAGGKGIPQVKVVEQELKLDWLDPSWETWGEFQKSPEWKEPQQKITD